MYRKLNGSLIWLAFLGLSALISAETADIQYRGVSGEGTAMYPDPLNPGQLKPADHDVYYREKCFCEPDSAWPLKTPNAGSYFHIEFFNHFQQLYFSLEIICKLAIGIDKRDENRCSPVLKKFHESTTPWTGHESFYGCVQNNETGYEWCYSASRCYVVVDYTWLGPPGVKGRGLWYNGDSLYDDQAQVLEECDRLCKENVDPGLTVYRPGEPGRTLNENIIDMYDNGWDDHW